MPFMKITYFFIRKHKIAVFVGGSFAALCLLSAMTLWNSQRADPSSIVPYAATAPASLDPGPQNNGTTEDPDTEELLNILKTRLERYTGPKEDWTKFVCHNYTHKAITCFDATCPGRFSSSLRDRLKQVLSTRSAIPSNYLQALTSATQSVTSHKYIFVTGASSDHFQEMQALLHNMFQSLFPRMKGEDFAFVVYNLGLTDRERRLTEKNCRCTLVDFPFAGLPDFVRHLKCYTWKPLIVASLLAKAEYLVWVDTSVRFRNSDQLQQMFQRARDNGYQTKHNDGSIAVRTRPSMAEFFGDHLCQYSPFTEMETGFVIFYNDRFTREVIMKPWLSCAFDIDCMCNRNHAKYLECRDEPRERFYGRCHRFEQSAIGMILSKLYLESRPMLYVPDGSIQIRRGHTMDWFKLR